MAISTIKSRPAGGFERLYVHYEVFIISKSTNEVLYKSTFSNENSTDEASRRMQTLEAIKENFRDCSKVSKRISAIEAALSSTDRVIEDFIKTPVYTLCD